MAEKNIQDNSMEGNGTGDRINAGSASQDKKKASTLKKMNGAYLAGPGIALIFCVLMLQGITYLAAGAIILGLAFGIYGLIFPWQMHLMKQEPTLIVIMIGFAFHTSGILLSYGIRPYSIRYLPDLGIYGLFYLLICMAISTVCRMVSRARRKSRQSDALDRQDKGMIQ